MLLERIVKGAEYLENPLIKPEEYERGMKLYDELCDLVDQYRELRDSGMLEQKLAELEAREDAA